MSDYYSLYTGASAEIEEKKSRFIATIKPAGSEREAAEIIADVKKKYYDARHNCTAIVIGDEAQIVRSNDDGEPSGTAGRPMLEVLTSRRITNAVCVVTRYFGGTLLGTGGLIRAYQGAVGAALDKCVVLKKLKGKCFKINCDYNDSGKITYLAANNNWNVMSTEYGEKVIITIIAEEEKVLGIEKAITDATAARALFTDEEDVIFAYIGDHIETF